VPGIFEFPESTPYAHAAFTETLACTMYGMEKSGASFGSRVAVVGCGGIGLAMLQLAKLRGATHVIMMDVVEAALEPLRAIPGVYTVNTGEGDPVKAVQALTEGYGADVVIEAVGRGETYKLAMELARRGGTIIGFGGCPPGTEFACDPNLIHYRSLNILGSYHYTPELFKQALNLIISGRIDLTPIVTSHLPMSRVVEAVDLYPRPEVKQLALDPWQ
jgi:L-iditol 2-dehydrogenase